MDCINELFWMNDMNHGLLSDIGNNVNVKNLKISIITVTLDCKEDLEDTILSVLSQNYEHKEFIIIDGLSKDGTLEIIDKYKGFLSITIAEKDRGIYDAMNKGIQKSSGNFIHFLNAGDKYCSEDSLQLISSYLQNKISLIKFGVIVEQGLLRRERASFLYLGRRMLNHQGLFYNRKVFRNNVFDPNLKIAGDFKHLVEYNLWKKVLYIDKPVVLYKGQGKASLKSSVLLNYKERMTIIKWKGCSFFLKCYIFSIALLGFYYHSFSKEKKW